MPKKKSPATNKVTTCQTCGKEIRYTTKKPKYCKEHQPPKQAAPAGGRKNNRNKHLYERSIFQVIEEVIICDAVRNGYYTWLRSPKGEPLQLDWYANCGIEIAFEIQGEQHYEFNRYFHRTQEDFNYQVACDTAKEQQCRKRGVFLFQIRYGTKVDVDYIIALLKSNNCLAELVRRGAIKDKYLRG